MWDNEDDEQNHLDAAHCEQCGTLLVMDEEDNDHGGIDTDWKCPEC